MLYSQTHFHDTRTLFETSRTVHPGIDLKMPSIVGPSHLINPLASPAHLETSASQLDGVPKDLEDSVRYETTRLLQATGILLRLPQEIIAQSIVILSRFWSGADGTSLLDCDAKVGKDTTIITNTTLLTLL